MTRQPNSDALGDVDDFIVAGRAADGDMNAFAVLVRRYTPMMRAYARRIMNFTSDVDDVVQESFVTAWQRLPDLDDPARVRPWLMRITGNKALDRLRALRAHVDIDDIAPPPATTSEPDRLAEGRAGVAELSRVLQEMPAPQREAWVLREVGGSSYDEIAAALDVPTSTARGLLARARKHIIVRMEGWR